MRRCSWEEGYCKSEKGFFRWRHVLYRLFRKFASNVGIEFKTPENLFLGDKTKVQIEGFNPKTIPSEGKLFANSDDTNVEFVEKEMVIMCGSPGAGKSTFWSNYLSDYERVNRDTLKTK